jgi:hypothetical protein
MLNNLKTSADLKQTYTSRIEEERSNLLKIKKKLNWLAIARLASFLLFAIAPFKIYPESHLVGIATTLVALVAFLILVKWNLRVKQLKKTTENLIKINEDELLALDHHFSQFHPGNEFIDPNHLNSYDLDIFGKGSIYQFLNRTVTAEGTKKLADLLQNPMKNPSDILKRQELITELASDIDWRQNFSAKGQLYLEDPTESEQLNLWGKELFQLNSHKIIAPLLYALPAISIASIVFWIVSGNSALFVLAALLQLGFWITERKNIKSVYAQFGKREQILSKYALLLELIEKYEWKSNEGSSIIKELKSKGLPSKETINLRKIISAFDNRNNFLLGIILNTVFMWDIWCSHLLIRWHNENRENYGLWSSTIAFFDAHNSLANYAFNHPTYTYPKPKTGDFELKAENMGHPLIHEEKRINNGFNIEGSQQIVIITGANMAGKSTFLRTVGVNMVLSMTGVPVCASAMEFTPVDVFSNMRTTDSLFDDESYFFAELKRIKAILDELSNGKKMLIILDEILKGTNSVDKLQGSQKLVKRLIGKNASAIIATHDLKLTEMANEYPEAIKNQCFEIEISNNEMHFDYKLHAGVTNTMNATFLMKKMGIIE